MQWNIQSQKTPKSEDEIIDILVKNRGITNREEFLQATSPMDLTLSDVGIDEEQLSTALTMLKSMHEKKGKIIIYGDYDCDGICATTILWETLHNLGFSVLPFIPDREKHGYGLSQRGVDEILSKGTPDMIISVDNGIVAHAQWQRLKDLGVATILTDHHEPDGKELVADSVIHTTKLCGTTVAWMLARGVVCHSGKGGDKEPYPESRDSVHDTGSPMQARFAASSRMTTKDIESMLDLCAIATIADQVLLTGANRSFAVFGLQQLNQTQRLGLDLLINASGLEKGAIDSYGVNFGIAPRINAMGRIGSAMDALRALCTKDPKKAASLIAALNETNSTRQDMTQEMLEIAFREKESWKEEHIIVVASECFHEGVIGLIAGKLTETFHKPSVVFALGSETAKGSARSVAGVHITNLMRQVSDDLLEVGGHPLAGGLKIETRKLEIVKTRLQTLARETVDTAILQQVIEVDCALPAQFVSVETAREIGELAPFGAGNPEPMFFLQGWQILDAKQIGKEKKHLKLSIVHSPLSIAIDALFWNKGHLLSSLPLNAPIDLVAKLEINEWKGNSSIQLTIKDLQDFSL